jgi:hypothetical protein
MKGFGKGRAAAALALFGLAGCAVVSPLLDRDMSKAPNMACVAVNGRSPAATAAQCFVLAEENVDGRRQRWSGGALAPGRTLVAVLQPGPACGGTLSHLTVTGSSPGAGRAELSTWDAVGRPGHRREVQWRQGFAERTLTMASIESATMNPAGARVRITEGSFDPASLCFRSY